MINSTQTIFDALAACCFDNSNINTPRLKISLRHSGQTPFIRSLSQRIFIPENCIKKHILNEMMGVSRSDTTEKTDMLMWPMPLHQI